MWIFVGLMLMVVSLILGAQSASEKTEIGMDSRCAHIYNELLLAYVILFSAFVIFCCILKK